MKDYIIGTWWLVKSVTGNRFITKATKVIRNGNTFERMGKEMKGWAGLDNNLRGMLVTEEGDTLISSKDFKEINFPDITYENSPMEIEIGKSGRVYTYES